MSYPAEKLQDQNWIKFYFKVKLDVEDGDNAKQNESKASWFTCSYQLTKIPVSLQNCELMTCGICLWNFYPEDIN